MTMIKDAIKGNSRVANALAREGIYTMNALHELHQMLGEKEFKERINDIRSFGIDSWDRLRQAMEDHPYSPDSPSGDSLTEGLPEGFQKRLMDTLRHLADQGAAPDRKLLAGVPEQKRRDLLVEVEGGSLTAGDLERLARVLFGYRYDLVLKAEW